MRFALSAFPHGIETAAGNRVVYDVARSEACFGASSVAGHALVWELDGEPGGDALISSDVELDDAERWLMRCDRVDFPPGGVAYRHTHPGPGIRCLLHGSIRIDTEGRSREYERLEAWFERGPDPVYAQASATQETAFVRVMLLPAAWRGKRTITYVDPTDADRPKLQRATILLETSIELR